MLPKSALRGMGLVALGGPSMRLKMFHVKVKKLRIHCADAYTIVIFAHSCQALYVRFSKLGRCYF